MKKIPRVILILLSLAGLAIMAYLFKVGYSDASSFCNLGEGLSCDLVNKSKYAKIFGIPLSGMGFLYFVWVLYIAIRSYKAETLKLLALATIIFLGPSLYLSGVEFFVIKSICVLCETSKVMMLAVLGVSLYAMRPKKVSWGQVLAVAIAGIVLAGVAYLAHSTSGPGKKYDEFAQCLDSKGYVMLGSATCASCLKQRESFGEAFRFIEEVECDPRNIDNQKEEEEVKFCETFQIKKTPTWVQLDEERNTLYRFDAGIQSFETLSSVSGCTLPADE
ncbi:MAG: hypothetical protein A3I44_06100 [Candidatus Sungbacteria bacterium RIFCSPLOWO2_02_FULL_51_17]|uniref:Vitamin K epoxide reductase domain-containing protein n=1 Tax=Candidatus Sungbacteria bacterium RIFCSPHIGHO2_02_FULL_51_29 TaxID=1802273 RepID=A0A1G2KXA9_9BACT|nr:MAG: hypothetical protein A2676_04415 [Candidatus Sungbacteria bacterium RIFCSPHIGHO2_01_FULL_51_22]OHA03844.1 MAG: hypothetical protein A3C16_05160 [Candidatus Sungbacteria bacterium RIFCSPHIGHO2_02_FULL_51_29]OHA05943.1 MAG: hypothetical protein A3B29_02490 [Candidatus Sungbacteria bacterium RIFCSPLOWO2_01_FULL_51_34]OHA10349.1 MAG: hypothetical protein A3I44_06100 [Candidatus Sungbacteria bacterium RIFCSPLOWO2_02_FULL_51_17]